MGPSFGGVLPTRLHRTCPWEIVTRARSLRRCTPRDEMRWSGGASRTSGGCLSCSHREQLVERDLVLLNEQVRRQRAAHRAELFEPGDLHVSPALKHCPRISMLSRAEHD